MIGVASAILAFDLWRELSYERAVMAGPGEDFNARWHVGLALTMLAWGPILLSTGILIAANG